VNEISRLGFDFTTDELLRMAETTKPREISIIVMPGKLTITTKIVTATTTMADSVLVKSQNLPKKRQAPA
jgi:hypothetical protein